MGRGVGTFGETLHVGEAVGATPNTQLGLAVGVPVSGHTTTAAVGRAVGISVGTSDTTGWVLQRTGLVGSRVGSTLGGVDEVKVGTVVGFGVVM